MLINFTKYQGAGNDFVIIDTILSDWISIASIADSIEQLCDRRFGIGADGLIMVLPSDDYDFRMVYFNADGKESTMCGNGGRCITHYYNHHIAKKERFTFLAIDGPHEAMVSSDNMVRLAMKEVSEIKSFEGYPIIDTGSPHCIWKNPPEWDNDKLFQNAISIRNHNQFKKAGINVNFYEEEGQQLKAITYERGVEDFTLACGTGATAIAIAHMAEQNIQQVDNLGIQMPGGLLEITASYDEDDKKYKNIWLKGPAVEVYKGALVL